LAWKDPAMRVMIVDDHPVARDGLRSALAVASDIEIVAEAGSGEEAVAVATEAEPDLIFMDVQMPGMDGLQAAKAIRSERPDTKVILFTVEESAGAVAEAMQAGISGYLLKDVTADEVVRAARLAMEGKAVIHPALTRSFIEESRLRPARSETPLSNRESEILQYVAHGNTTKEVARHLGISPHTVKTHLERIFEKLGANDRAQAVYIAFRLGLVD
jgi:DNA-binding NarL/FixJ family response regulator